MLGRADYTAPYRQRDLGHSDHEYTRDLSSLEDTDHIDYTDHGI